MLGLNKIITTIMFCLLGLSVLSQANKKYWVAFEDKEGSAFNTANVSLNFSEKAIANRLKYGIEFDFRDLPISETYLDGLTNIDSVEVLGTSRWFNAALISCDSISFYSEVLPLPFVMEGKRVKSLPYVKPDFKGTKERNLKFSDAIYGPSFVQTAMISAQHLHQAGWRGENVDIAVMDSGFEKVLDDPIFEAMIEDGRLKEARNFVKPEASPFGPSTHGSFVLSTMGGFMPDSLIGTAPEANYYLYQTEESGAENVIEEAYWVFAAERADSIGIDIINTSLGYQGFDLPANDHSYSDMNGNTTLISRAADIAASKGILVVTSAGNSGDDPWRYITAPADADSVLAVGAVNANEAHGWFSSFGPSSDGDVKPNVMAMGVASVFADLDGGIRTGNGTSFSAPILAGGVACLRQAHPARTPMEIIEAVEKSAHLYETPNDSMGYGIPNLWTAHELLEAIDAKDIDWESNVYPNPSKGPITLETTPPTDGLLELRMISAEGKVIWNTESEVIKGVRIVLPFPEVAASGVYHIELRLGELHDTTSVVITGR